MLVWNYTKLFSFHTKLSVDEIKLPNKVYEHLTLTFNFWPKRLLVKYLTSSGRRCY